MYGFFGAIGVISQKGVRLYTLFGFNVAFKHLSHVATLPTCSNGTSTKSASTHECHAADTGHDTPPRHSIQTQGRPVVVLSIIVERHNGIHNYPF